MNNDSFQAVRIAAGEIQTKGVCTLVVSDRTESEFLLRFFKIAGAEGGTRTPFCFTGFFTLFAKSPTKSHFSFLRSLHCLHYPHSAVP